MTRTAKKSYDTDQSTDPWLRLVHSATPPPCDCPCHRWPDLKHGGPCCVNAGRRYVPAGGYYTEHESEDR